MNRLPEIPRDTESLVLFLFQQGSRRDAVRVYQEEAQIGRTQARRAVRGLARQHGVTTSGAGIADLVLVALMVCSMLLGLMTR
jgi:hypothetical protein